MMWSSRTWGYSIVKPSASRKQRPGRNATMLTKALYGGDLHSFEQQ